MAELDEPFFEEHPEARERWFRTLWELGNLDEAGNYIAGD
jgi:hypothetical protein